MELREKMRKVLGEFYIFGPKAYPELADPVIDAILALPEISEALGRNKVSDFGLWMPGKTKNYGGRKPNV